MPNKTKFLVPKMVQRKVFLFFLAVTGMETFSLCNALGFEKKLQVGTHVGYSGTYIKSGSTPNVFNGAAVGLQIVYGLNDTVGVSVDGTFDWHKNYREYNKEEVADDDGKVSMDWVPGSKISRYFVSTTAVSIIYAIDVTRVVPYLSAGAVGARIDRTTDGVHDATYGIGLRLGGGFDYFFNRFSVGAGIITDRYYGGNSDHNRRILFLLRISSVFQFKAESLAARKTNDSIHP